MIRNRARLIIDCLLQQGLDYFCLSPGSRSTPLALAIAENPAAKPMIHFDERGMSFHALGYAKATGNPAVVICTTGTAAGNLLPAIMEAHHSRVPLIVLTSDRPQELRDTGFNQACDQVKIYRDFVRWQIDLATSDPLVPDKYIGSTIAQAVYRARSSPSGPVHVNLMFREPFLEEIPVETTIQSTSYEPFEKVLSPSSLKQWAERLGSIEKGIILAGSVLPHSNLQSIFDLAKALDWPVFPDIISGCRSLGDHSHAIGYYDPILKIHPELQADAILHFGDRLVSKPLLEWLSKLSPKYYFAVADHPFRHDPKHLITHRVDCDPLFFCEQLAPLISPRAGWAAEWKQLSDQIETRLDEFTAAQKNISEPGLVRFLHAHFPSDWALFISSSMPIRDADSYFFPRHPIGPIFCNRGLSGIDGNIGTAIGIAEGRQKPTLALLGDLASLHDINSLAQCKKSKTPVIFLIVNNYGGAMFSFLPIAEKKVHFEEFWAAAHPYSFEAAAKLFDLPYYHPLEKDSFEDTLKRAFRSAQSCVIEINTDRDENFHLHKEMTHMLQEALCSPAI